MKGVSTVCSMISTATLLQPFDQNRQGGWTTLGAAVCIYSFRVDSWVFFPAIDNSILSNLPWQLWNRSHEWATIFIDMLSQHGSYLKKKSFQILCSNCSLSSPATVLILRICMILKSHPESWLVLIAWDDTLNFVGIHSMIPSQDDSRRYRSNAFLCPRVSKIYQWASKLTGSCNVHGNWCTFWPQVNSEVLDAF